MTQMTEEELVRRQAELLQRVWEDDAFKARLKADPRAVMTEMGIPVPEGVELRVVEDTDTVKHLPLPPFVGPAGG